MAHAPQGPHATRVAPLTSSTSVAEYDGMAGTAREPSAPPLFCPQHTTRPSARAAHACSFAVHTSTTSTVRGGQNGSTKSVSLPKASTAASLNVLVPHRPSAHALPNRQSRSERHSARHRPATHAPSLQSPSRVHVASNAGSKHASSRHSVPGAHPPAHAVVHRLMLQISAPAQSPSLEQLVSSSNKHTPNPDSLRTQLDPAGQSRGSLHSLRQRSRAHTRGAAH